jgi:hypothetical protein
MRQIEIHFPDAVQRHQRVYARLRHAMAVRRRSGIVTSSALGKVPVLQRTTPLRFVLRCARDTRLQ